jgi:hypothetical protein
MESLEHRQTLPFDRGEQVIHNLVDVGAVVLDEPDIGAVVDVSPEHLLQTFLVKRETPRQISLRFRERVKPRLTEGLTKSPLQLTVPVVWARLSVPLRNRVLRLDEYGNRRHVGADREGSASNSVPGASNR